jgi:asparagine synthase (glutamine-hydrolysing)
MCGITGIFHFDSSREVDSSVLKRMTDSLIHRGPDGEGYYINKNIGLGHRRLSIIDLKTGDQPLFNADRSIGIVFNGELYNYIELREDLKKLGHSFRTDSDTEVVVKAYEEWGTACLGKFNGMWAFALWDDRKKTLFISRDRIGEKPIFFSTINRSFVFGSEIKSILQYGIEKEINPEVLELYLVLGFVPSPYTYYRNIYKLEPGHYLIVSENGLQKLKYWNLPMINEEEMIRDPEIVHKTFEELLYDSVRIRMRSDVPFGAFLSGGLDSSSIVALMSRISKNPVSTFTIGFDEKEFDESGLAKEVADQYRTDHYNQLVHQDSFDDSLNKVLYHYDEPFGDSSAIPTGYVSAFASKYVKMVLTGDGGDEVLSGYTGYQGEKFADTYQKLPRFIKKGLPDIISFGSGIFRGNIRYKLIRSKRVLHTSNLPFTERMIQKMSWGDNAEIEKLFVNSQQQIKIRDYFGQLFEECPFRQNFNKMMFMNYKLTLPDDMLVKVDRMSMAYSLETRTPFIDYRLVEFMATVDKDVKMKGYERKSVLRNTIAKELPPDLLKARKRGFVVPLREWFKDENFKPKLDELERSPYLPLNKKALKSIILQHREGKENYGNFIWMLFVLDKWLKN